MLKTSTAFKTSSRSLNRDAGRIDSGDSTNIDDKVQPAERRVDRILQAINENVPLDQVVSNASKCDSPQHGTFQPEPVQTRDELTLAEIDALLRSSGTAVQDVHCDVEESAVILTGQVRRYHHLQIVLQIAMRCRAGREIINRIGVDSNAIS
ncbi:BON domain-containing protein [Schlesneria paludicola]|uniref:hypothetical protein n=1 Tax=Schlesneria paludicola TaxID=360056 RepID=UPI00029B2D42|nr:hypothetical protein [Schlesneria paludicola]